MLKKVMPRPQNMWHVDGKTVDRMFCSAETLDLPTYSLPSFDHTSLELAGPGKAPCRRTLGQNFYCPALLCYAMSH